MKTILKDLLKQTIDALECLADDDNNASIILKLQGLLAQPEVEPVCYVQLGIHGRVFSMNDSKDSECVTPTPHPSHPSQQIW